MKTLLTAFALALVCTSALSADVTVTTKSTVTGKMAAMIPVPPEMITRVKGLRVRTDLVGAAIPASSIIDANASEMIALRHDQKTASVISIAAREAGAVAARDTIALPQPSASTTPTGASRVIDGVRCDEHAVLLMFEMSELTGGGRPLPPEAVEMLKGVKMVVKGSVWVAKEGPGVADYVAFKKAAESAGLASILTGAMPGRRQGGIGSFMTSLATVPGIPYLSEITLSIDGTGEAAEMMKEEMGTTTFTNRVTSVSTDGIADDLFVIPQGYSVSKRD